MSILSAAAEIVPTTNPIAPVDSATAELVASIILLVFAVAAIGLAAALGVFKPSKILGPIRVPFARPLWPLVIVLVTAAVIWIGAQTAYVMGRVVQHQQQHAPAGGDGPSVTPTFSVADFTATDYAVLATIPGLIALAAIIIGDRAVGREWFSSLGWNTGRLPIGLALGFIAALVTLPLTYGSTVLLEWFYNFIHFEHPDQHELLGALRSANNPIVKYAMIAGAALVAPLWEEVAFRGHLQTLIGAGLAKLFPARPVLEPSPVAGAALATVPMATNTALHESQPLPEPLGYSAPALDQVMIGPNIWQRWLAIGLTSMLFAVVHEMWTWPAIFILSVCLGYAYERTGNLWVPIFIHLAFNTVSTVLFLSQAV